MPKRQPVNTVSGALQVAQLMQNELRPPAHVPLSEDDLPFWNSIIQEKPRSEWTAHDLEVAAHLAQAMADLVNARKELRASGGAVTEKEGKFGTVFGNNPWSQAVRDESARIVSFRSTLQIHGRGKNGEFRDVTKRRDQAGEIEGALQSDNDPLIPGLVRR